MPLDHYVSQVHLRNFYSPALDNLMHVIRKSDLKRFVARSQDVCRIEDNSSNAYLLTDRVVEEFLKLVEPRYNASVAKLREHKFDVECVECIAGFVAYVISCSPTAMRVSTGPLKSSLEATAQLLDAQGAFDKAPPALGGKSLTELLKEGTIHFTVDEKFPQAMGISSIAGYVSIFGNSIWEVLTVDPKQGTPFFSSDFPVAMEFIDVNAPINRVVPLAPDLAIRIIPDIRLSRAPPDFSFSNLRVKQRRLSRSEAINANQLIVRCAEDLVFFRDNLPWVDGFVAKNSKFRVEPVDRQIPTDGGSLQISTIRIKPMSAALSATQLYNAVLAVPMCI